MNSSIFLKQATNATRHNDEIKIHYTLDFSRYYEHLVNVEMSFEMADFAHLMGEDGLDLWLPTWIAGSYLIREFSKNITNVHYYDEKGQVYRAIKTSKNHYRLANSFDGLGKMRVCYEVYCHDLSVRTAFVDDRRLFGNFTSLLLMLSGGEQALSQVHLRVPKQFLQNNQGAVLACGLSHVSDKEGEYSLHAMSAFEYYDYPFEFGMQARFEFGVDCQGEAINHRFFLAGHQRADLERLSCDVQKICQSYVAWLGDTPFADYTFMTMVTGSDYGGLEHINSTALITPRTDLPVCELPLPSESYQRFLGLCSHEYFHAWWVKSVRPDVMMENDLQQEAYTPLLWVFEGFTSYIDDLMLLVSGVIDKKSYFKLLTSQINRYYKTDGRHHQSVAESSFDTWIKLYRPDENTNNQGVSYYNKGALVALCLDLMLLKHSRGKYRLFDVIKIFYEKSKETTNKRFGMSTLLLGDVIGGLMGSDEWQDFYEKYVVGVDELPLAELLNEFGVVMQTADSETVWGMSIDETPSGLKIKHIHRDSTASLAGLSVGDVIVAIDGIRASTLGVKSALLGQNTVQVHAFRRDELRTFEVAHYRVSQHLTVSVREYTEKGWLIFDKWWGMPKTY